MINAKTVTIFIFSIVIFLLFIYIDIAASPDEQILIPFNTWSEICSNTDGHYLSSQFSPPLSIFTTAEDVEENPNGCSWLLQQLTLAQSPIEIFSPRVVRVFFKARCTIAFPNCISNIQVGSYVRKVDTTEDTRYWNLSLNETWSQYELTMYDEEITRAQLFFYIPLQSEINAIEIDDIIFVQVVPLPTETPTPTSTATATPVISCVVQNDYVGSVFLTSVYTSGEMYLPENALGEPDNIYGEMYQTDTFICGHQLFKTNLVSGTIWTTVSYTNSYLFGRGSTYLGMEANGLDFEKSSDWSFDPITITKRFEYLDVEFCDSSIFYVGRVDIDSIKLDVYDGCIVEPPTETPTPTMTPTATPTPTTPCIEYSFFYDLNDFNVVYGNWLEGIGIQSENSCAGGDCTRAYRATLPIKDIESVIFSYNIPTTKSIQIQTAYTNFYSGTILPALTDTITIDSHDDEYIIFHLGEMEESTVLRKLSICGEGLPPTATATATPIIISDTVTPPPTQTPTQTPTPITPLPPTYAAPPTTDPNHTPSPLITPIPTPVIITDSLITDFYYSMSKSDTTCYVLIPAIPNTNFIGITICIDYYNLRLIVWGIEIPVYYIFAAIGIFIVWRVFIWTV